MGSQTDSSINKSNIWATLRKEAEMAENGGGMYYSGWALSERADAIEDLMRENAKLSEFVQAVAVAAYEGKMLDCLECRFFDQCYNDEAKEHDGRGCQWWLWAHEFGIEVSNDA